MDLETCSHCLEEVEDDTLTEQYDGARICTDCVEEAFLTLKMQGWTDEAADRHVNMACDIYLCMAHD